MLGTIINTVLIIVGSLLGLVLRRGIPERMKATVMHAMGLVVILIGLQGALKTEDMLCVVVCMAVGTLIGSALNIEKGLDHLGGFAEKKMARFNTGEGSISKGFVSASLVFCVGAMAIVGSIESGIEHNYTTLVTKGVIDGISSIFFASTMGIGVALSGVAVFVYQGAITLLAGLLKPILTEPMINEMSAVGGLLIVGIGLNLMRDKHIAVGNMLPAIFLPLVYLPIASLFTQPQVADAVAAAATLVP